MNVRFSLWGIVKGDQTCFHCFGWMEVGCWMLGAGCFPSPTNKPDISSVSREATMAAQPLLCHSECSVAEWRISFVKKTSLIRHPASLQTHGRCCACCSFTVFLKSSCLNWECRIQNSVGLNISDLGHWYTLRTDKWAHAEAWATLLILSYVKNYQFSDRDSKQ